MYIWAQSVTDKEFKRALAKYLHALPKQCTAFDADWQIMSEACMDE
jgi:hypothetical protein